MTKGLSLTEALESGYPFRRPSWYDSEAEFKWVIVNGDILENTGESILDCLDWAKDTGQPSGNCFSYLSEEDKKANDYEVKIDMKLEFEKLNESLDKLLNESGWHDND